jgi:hypothetical protein
VVLEISKVALVAFLVVLLALLADLQINYLHTLIFFLG